MAKEMRGAEEVFEQMQDICVGRPAADVMYALGKMIAKGIIDNSSTTDLETTLGLLRETAKFEIQIARD